MDATFTSMHEVSSPTTDAGASGEPEFTIDELVARTGVPSRTIRFYQARGALPPPVRRGRMAFYGPDHVERLELVAHLQDRGLSLKAIRDLVTRSDGAEVSVSQWLGLGEKLSSPWTEDRPRFVTEAELGEMAGAPLRPGLIAELVRAGLLQRESSHTGTFLATSPGLLGIALKLAVAGVDTETAIGAHTIMRRRLGRAADDLAEYFVKQADLDELGPEGVESAFEALRTLGIDAVRLVFAQEMERSLREAVESGKLVPGGRKRRKRG